MLRFGALAAAVAEAPLRGAAEPLVLSLGEADAPRPDRRDGDVDDGEVAWVAPADEASLLEPAEPVVSAKAIGIAATAEPTPRAMASAPTRPT